MYGLGNNKMSREITYGIGGYCENCDETHDHPPHNLISDIEIADDQELPDIV